MATIHQFNELALEFLHKMEETFPNEQKIKTYIYKFQLLKSINSNKPVEMFMESMYPFGEQIMTSDEEYFKKDEYINNAENISGKIGLVNYWDSLNEQTKNSIREYIKGLYILGMAVTGKEGELAALVQKLNI